MDSERMNRSALAKISRTLENTLQYIRGTGKWFSARDKGAVLSQLIDAQKELDKAAKVIEAARGLDSDFGRAIALGERDAIEANMIEDYMEGVRLLDVLFKTLAAYDSDSEGGGE